jgi:hypothetical protein
MGVDCLKKESAKKRPKIKELAQNSKKGVIESQVPPLKLECFFKNSRTQNENPFVL